MKRPAAAQAVAALLAGLLFGCGLALAQMTDPLKVLAFLDIAGRWDPSLALVLGGAVSLGFVAFHFILRRPKPLLTERFDVPVNRRWLDLKLWLGATLFGVGWGIGGYCPGPAIVQLAAPNSETWIFLPALIAGTVLARVVNRDRS